MITVVAAGTEIAIRPPMRPAEAITSTTDVVADRSSSSAVAPACAVNPAATVTRGPSEAATCRLKDGRLMTIFRLGSGHPYGQVFSRDEGRTWTEPVALKGVFSVQPCLVVLKDGMVV